MINYYGVCPYLDCPYKMERPDDPPPGYGTETVHILEKKLGFKVEKYERLQTFMPVRRDETRSENYVKQTNIF